MSFLEQQAEVVFSEESIGWLTENVVAQQQQYVMDTIDSLFAAPRASTLFHISTRQTYPVQPG